VSLTSQVQTAGGSLAGNEHSPISSTVDPRWVVALSSGPSAAVDPAEVVRFIELLSLVSMAGGVRSGRCEQRAHGRSPGTRDLHQRLLRCSGVVCSDEAAHGEPPARACYLGWTRAELLGEFGDARVTVLEQSKQHSHLCGGVLTALEPLEHMVECLVSGRRRVSVAVALDWTPLRSIRLYGLV
jgi:hypothetical protein